MMCVLSMSERFGYTLEARSECNTKLADIDCTDILEVMEIPAKHMS